MQNPFIVAKEDRRFMVAYRTQRHDLILRDSREYCHYAKISWGDNLEVRDAWHDAQETVFARVARGLLTLEQGKASLRELENRMLKDVLIESRQQSQLVGGHFHRLCVQFDRTPHLVNPDLCHFYPQDRIENFVQNLTRGLNEVVRLATLKKRLPALRNNDQAWTQGLIRRDWDLGMAYALLHCVKTMEGGIALRLDARMDQRIVMPISLKNPNRVHIYARAATIHIGGAIFRQLFEKQYDAGFLTPGHGWEMQTPFDEFFGESAAPCV